MLLPRQADNEHTQNCIIMLSSPHRAQHFPLCTALTPYALLRSYRCKTALHGRYCLCGGLLRAPPCTFSSVAIDSNNLIASHPQCARPCRLLSVSVRSSAPFSTFDVRNPDHQRHRLHASLLRAPRRSLCCAALTLIACQPSPLCSTMPFAQRLSPPMFSLLQLWVQRPVHARHFLHGGLLRAPLRSMYINAALTLIAWQPSSACSASVSAPIISLLQL